MGASGMGVDANGKPIKRQPTNNTIKKAGGNNNNQQQKKGNNKNQQQNNRNNQGNNNNNNRNRHIQPPMPLIPPFGPMGGPMGGGGFMGGPPGNNGPFFNGNQNRRSGGGGNGKNNGNRNGAPQSGYNGPSANNVGQGIVGASMNPFGPPQDHPSSMEVPGFGKNSNIHELFGKMIWRKMEQIQDPALVDQLQNRIMNLIHDALAGQNEQKQQSQQQQRGMGMAWNSAPSQQKGPAFGNNFSRF